MTIKKKSQAAKPKFNPGDDTLLEIVGTNVCIGNLNRNTIKCEMSAEGVLFTIVCPMSMVTYFGENGSVPVSVASLEVLATKQFFEKLGKETEEDN